MNKDFSVCSSYPPLVVVPKDVDDDTLRKVATFRHNGRFPVLSYYHRKNGMVSAWKYKVRFSFCGKIFVVDFSGLAAVLNLYLKSLLIPGNDAIGATFDWNQRAAL